MACRVACAQGRGSVCTRAWRALSRASVMGRGGAAVLARVKPYAVYGTTTTSFGFLYRESVSRAPRAEPQPGGAYSRSRGRSQVCAAERRVVRGVQS